MPTTTFGAYNDVRAEVTVGIDKVSLVMYDTEEDEPHGFKNSDTD